jgi:hypothetical protein
MFKSKKKRWTMHTARMGRKGMLGKPDGKRPLGRHRRRWNYSIKMVLRVIGWDDMDWIDLAEDREWRPFVNTVMNLRVPCWEIFEWLSNWQLLKKH